MAYRQRSEFLPPMDIEKLTTAANELNRLEGRKPSDYIDHFYWKNVERYPKSFPDEHWVSAIIEYLDMLHDEGRI